LQLLIRRLLTTGKSYYLETQRLPVIQESPKQAFRLDTFCNSGERAVIADQKYASHVPVATVGQRQNGAFGRIQGGIEKLFAFKACQQLTMQICILR